jgi:putative hydrolase of the HAD superfamily
MPAEVIFLDAGGTLFRPWPSVGEIYARTALKHGVIVPAADVEKAFHEKWHLRNGLASNATTSEKIERDWWYAFVQDVFHNVDAFDDFDAFFAELYDLFARAECWRLFDDTLPALDLLKAKGYRLAILSNWDHRLFTIVEQLGLSSYFETVIASSSVGSSKPARRIFEAALNAMKITPERCVHVGDSVTDDYEGARLMGIQPVLIDRSARAYNGFIRMTSLMQLPDVIQ